MTAITYTSGLNFDGGGIDPYSIQYQFNSTVDFDWYGGGSGPIIVGTDQLALFNIFTQAGEAISDVLTTDLSDGTAGIDVNNPTGLQVSVDDLLVRIEISNGAADGAGGVFGVVGSNGGLNGTTRSTIQPGDMSIFLDLEDVAAFLALTTDEQLDIATNLLLQAVGLGVTAGASGLIFDNSGTLGWIGSAAHDAYLNDVLGGDTSDPGYLAGFTPFDSTSPNLLPGQATDPLNSVVVGALADLGLVTLPCFLAGTGIATPDGARAVETLGTGDTILTAEGTETKVLWVGRRRVENALVPEGWRQVVEISAGALGHDLPERVLRVTADHAMLLGGMLIEAGALVNGSNIRWHTPEGAFTVYHIETEGHQIIRAEGAATETYVDYVARRAFDNFAEYAALYGDGSPIEEMPLPRITRGDQARKTRAA